MLKSTFRAVLSKLSIPLWLAILLSATVPVLAAQQHRANLEAAAIGPQPQVVEQDHVLSFEQASYTVSESAGSLDVIVELTEPYTETTTVTVDYSTSDDTATAGEDYTSASGMLAFPPNVITDTFTVNILQDDVDEGDETFTLNLTGASGATIGTPTAPVTITDDDDASVQFAPPTSPSVNENAGTVDVTVELSNESTSEVSVQYETNDGTATAGEDYTDTSGTLPIPAGDVTGTISIPILNDALHEDDETFTVALTGSTGASVVTPDSVTVTILDGDPQPTVQFGDSAYEVGEDGGSATITVTLSTASGSNVEVTASTTSGGTATAGSDYTTTNAPLTFLPGETSQTFTVPITNDSLDEENETVQLELGGVSGATLGTLSTATLTITDNDSMPSVSFDRDSYSVEEGNGTRQVTVELSAASGLTVTVDYTTSDGSAVAGSDYTASSGTLTFAPGDTSKTFSVPIIDDDLDEPTESVNLELTAPNNAEPGSTMSATIFIIDDDPTPTVKFHDAPYTVNEGDGSATITVVLSNPASGVVSVDYATADGTATAGADYTERDNTLVFSSGMITRTFSVPINDDLVDENDETVNLTLSNAQGADLGTPSASELTIVDNDGLTEIRFASATYSVTESAGTASITVVRSGLSVFDASVDYATVPGGSATAGTDYTPVSGTLNFEPDETSKTFEVPIIADQLNEPDETVNLELSDVSGALLPEPRTATLTIHDSNETPAVQFSQDTYSVDESMLTADITVTLSIAKAQEVTVHYGLQEGTATLGEDYANTGGTFTIPAGQRAGNFTVPLLPDQLDEPDETVILSLTDAEGADLGERTSATLIILDNDPTPTLSFSLSSLIVGETDGTADVPVRLSAASGRTVTVNYATVDGTAIAGSDYVATSGTLTFSPGDTSKTINVPLLESLAGEPDETFTVELSAPTNATLTTPDTAVVTIVDGKLDLSSAFFPITFSNYALGEPNDGCSQAYEVVPFKTYHFLPDDEYDYYRFTLEETAHLIIEVTNFVPITGQAALWKSAGGEFCTSWEEDPINNGTPGTDKTIDAGIQTPGEYLIIVVTTENYSTSDAYRLQIHLEPQSE